MTDGHLTRIIEKPGRDYFDAPGPGALVSMNLWRFDERIFDACRDVPLSARGEYELPEAVGLAIAAGVVFRTFRASGAVLDLSRRATWRIVSARLAGRGGAAMNAIAAHFEVARHDARGRRVARRARSPSSTQHAAPILEGAAEWRRFTPGRIEIFGKHTDYAGGHSLLAAVPRGITLAARRRDRRHRARRRHLRRPVIEVDPSKPAPAHYRGLQRYVHVVAHRFFLNFPGVRARHQHRDRQRPAARVRA